jgi:hypothetical protein
MSDEQILEKNSQQKSDLAHDLINSSLIKEKCKKHQYAQHLYAGLCNNNWSKLDVIPILKNEIWHCSWRSAGRIVADITETGDYMDWYCSGLISGYDDEPASLGYVSEGTVTKEIQKDLRSLGWICDSPDSASSTRRKKKRN